MDDPAQPAGFVSDDQKLTLLNQVINQVQTTQPVQPSVIDQVIPGVAAQAASTLNPQAGVRTGQERVDQKTPDSNIIDAVSSQPVEIEKTPELPVEVEGYLQHAQDHQDQLPQEIVVSGDDITLQPSHRPTTPVVVLPINQADEKKARLKNTSWSIKWLIEWSHKIIKMFVGKVIYRQEDLGE